jgi:phosphoesterase RecJ-like protein
MTREAMDRSGASEEDSDNIINYPLTIGDVEAVAFFRELPNSSYRVSLRSKNRVNVARIAEEFGGGGHTNAAGFTVQADYQQLHEEVLDKLRVAVETAPHGHGREIKPR